MKFNTKTRYGLRAMIEIARETDNSGIFQKDISERQQISNKYLDHIIYALKVAGLITNVKGKKSGYILTRRAVEISVLDINNAFEPGICVVDCIMNNYECERENACSAKNFWVGLNDLISNHLKNTTLQNLLSQQIELETKEAKNG